MPVMIGNETNQFIVHSFDINCAVSRHGDKPL